MPATPLNSRVAADTVHLAFALTRAHTSSSTIEAQDAAQSESKVGAVNSAIGIKL